MTSDYERVSAWRARNRKPCPGQCGQEVAWDTKFCRACWARIKRETALDLSVKDIKTQKKSHRWTDHVRYFAREMHTFEKCEICGYDKFVEIAHIQPIHSFPDTATIREINDISNVRGLCRNHHWEFDHGVLEEPL